MGEVEKYGTGFVRIRDLLKEYPELEYKVEDLGDFIRVNLAKINNTDKHDTLNDPLKNRRILC